MNTRHLLGIDIGGTNVKIFFDTPGNTLKRIYPTGDEITVSELEMLLESICNKLPVKPDFIGIAFSGTTKDSKSVYKSNLPCLPSGFDASFLHKYTKSIAFANDANAMTICGLYENPNSKVLVSITCGSGLGMGIMINGKLFTGANGFAGEIHGNFVGSYDTPFKAGKLASGRYLKKHMSESDFSMYVKQSGTYLGMVITHVVNCFNPDTIFLSGGCLQFKGYKETAETFLRNNGYPDLTKDLNVVYPTESLFAGAIGASKLNIYI